MNQDYRDRVCSRSNWTFFAAGSAALVALAWPLGLATAAPAHVALVQDNEKDLKAEFDKRFEAAKSDIVKLWELYDWCEAYSLQKYHKRVLNAVLKLDENDRRAHEALGHEEYDGKWWDDPKKLEKYRLEKEKDEAEAKGYVIYKGRYVDPKDIPFLERRLRAPGPGVDRARSEGEHRQGAVEVRRPVAGARRREHLPRVPRA
jgi:hypothetical protein